MRPINPNAAEPANIISIDTLKRAETPVNTTSIVTDAINGLEKLANNPVFAPYSPRRLNSCRPKPRRCLKERRVKRMKVRYYFNDKS